MPNSDSFPSTYRSAESSKLGYFYDRPGTTPGQLNIRADAPPAELVLIDYDRDRSTRISVADPASIHAYLDTHTVSWIDVLGLGNTATWTALSSIFNLHRMLVEDIVNVPQRPKIEHYQDQLLIIATMVVLNPDGTGFSKEQVSLVLGKNYLLTVQEEPEEDCFHGVRQRIEIDRGIVGFRYGYYSATSIIRDAIFTTATLYGTRHIARPIIVSTYRSKS